MRRFLVLLSTALLSLAVGVGTASASSAHFKKGGEPTCTTTTNGSSSSTVCGASLSGLGNGDLLINVTVKGFAVYQCQNGGGNIAPGQNKVVEGPTTTPTVIPGSQIKNGNVTFTTNPAGLSAASTVSASDAGCPNNNWIGVDPTLTTTSVEMTISQSGVLLFDCTATNPNGLSGSYPLSC